MSTCSICSFQNPVARCFISIVYFLFSIIPICCANYLFLIYHCLSRLSISIEHLFSKKAQKKIPVLSVIDDGHGMTYPDMMRMISFGHKRPNGHHEDQIGRFGIGFKVEISQLKMSSSSSISVFLLLKGTVLDCTLFLSSLLMWSMLYFT